jgi:tripartite ATP-independent transporter DctP family solute receptor
MAELRDGSWMAPSRRAMVGGIGAALLAAPFIRRANAEAPEFNLKLGNDAAANHPMNLRLAEAQVKIAERSGGRMTLQIFPNEQLGSDTDMMSQVRSGAMEMLSLSGNILSTLLPVAGLYNMPFAFSKYYDVWAAMDGELGNYMRSKIETVGLHAFEKHWDNGFRQITSGPHPINTPEDMKGFKIRVPVSPLWLSLFKALGASPTSINFSETYTALQTHIVDGQDNALTILETAKLFEVQKYCALTNHIWDGFYMLVNRRLWARLPPDLQHILSEEINAAALNERADVASMNEQLEAQLAKQGMIFNRPDLAAFRTTLAQSGFFGEWKRKYGDQSWALLEKAVGKLG